MKFSELKNKKKVTAFIREPFNKRIKFKVEEQINAITEEDIYKIHCMYFINIFFRKSKSMLLRKKIFIKYIQCMKVFPLNFISKTKKILISGS